MGTESFHLPTSRLIIFYFFLMARLVNSGFSFTSAAHQVNNHSLVILWWAVSLEGDNSNLSFAIDRLPNNCSLMVRGSSCGEKEGKERKSPWEKARQAVSVQMMGLSVTSLFYKFTDGVSVPFLFPDAIFLSLFLARAGRERERWRLGRGKGQRRHL